MLLNTKLAQLNDSKFTDQLIYENCSIVVLRCNNKFALAILVWFSLLEFTFKEDTLTHIQYVYKYRAATMTCFLARKHSLSNYHIES